jgi:hypothetical protein
MSIFLPGSEDNGDEIRKAHEKARSSTLNNEYGCYQTNGTIHAISLDFAISHLIPFTSWNNNHGDSYTQKQFNSFEQALAVDPREYYKAFPEL